MADGSRVAQIKPVSVLFLSDIAKDLLYNYPSEFVSI